MILFYIDESGTGLGDKNSPYFLLASVGVKAEDWKVIDGQLRTLKQKWIDWAKPEDFEVKGRDIRRGEKFFASKSWQERVSIIMEMADFISTIDSPIFIVQVMKDDLSDYIKSNDQLYRLAFVKLLNELNLLLQSTNETGLLMCDARSDLHSSVQDRRLIDVYTEWVANLRGESQFIELPWFGFSAFYAGLQIADFTAYMIDFMTNESISEERGKDLHKALSDLRNKVKIFRLP